MTGPIAAIVHDRGNPATGACVEAVTGQSRRPDRLIIATTPNRAQALRRSFGSTAEIVPDPAPLAAAAERVGAEAAWVWLVEGATAPAPDALGVLLERADAWSDPRLCLLSSALVDGAGNLLGAEAPMPHALDPDLAAQGFERRTCPLRVASYGSLLVRADCLKANPPPPAGPGEDLMWSARLLTNRLGLLVPQSLAVAPSTRTGRERLKLLTGWTRLLLSDALPTREKPWIGFIYAERAAALMSDSAPAHRSGEAHPRHLAR